MSAADAGYRRAVEAYAAGRIDAAKQAAEAVVAAQRQHADALSLLGVIAFDQGDYDRAKSLHEQTLRIDRKSPEYFCNYATALVELGRLNDAMNAFEKALKIRPDLDFAAAGLAKALERRGRLARARQIIEPFIKSGQAGLAMRAVLARIEQREDNHRRVVEIAEAALQHDHNDAIALRQMLFIAGQSCEVLGDHDEAFSYLSRGNAILAQPWDEAATAAHYAAIRQTFDGPSMERFPRAAHGSTLPVLIVGMPRSGSTLIEQIIHAHNKGCGAGELGDLPRLAAQMPQTLGLDQAYPACMASVTADDLNTLAKPYLARLRRLGRGAARVADKALTNFINLGLVNLLLPEGRVVHTRRNPMDTCLSCFSQNLSPRLHPWSTDLQWIGRYYRLYDDLMSHWREVLSISMLELQYEEIVADQETWSRRLIEFLDLPWDVSCLKFHEVKRDVATSSYEQVTRPVYTTSVARHERFAKHLGPLRDALGDLVSKGVQQ